MPEVIDLSRNEGCPPPLDCLDVLKDRGPGLLGNYASATPLEAAYAEYLETDPANVLATTGGDDAIDRVFRAFLEPGKEVIFPTPTFEMIPDYARMAHGRIVPVEYEWGALPHDGILDRINERTGMVAIVCPDNPTGHAFTKNELFRLSGALPEDVLVLMDAAYVEYADSDHTLALLELPNVLTIRSMSKAWGLAGLRIGFAVGPARKIDRLRGFGGPYPLTGPSIAIGIDRLMNGVDEMRGNVRESRTRGKRLATTIRSAGGSPLPSQANFVLASFPDSRWIHRGMVAQGVLVRQFEHLPGHVRITVPRNTEEMELVNSALGCLAWRGARKPDALLFDMDGVLADVRLSYREAIARTCATYGLKADQKLVSAVKRAGNANDDWAVTHGVLARAGIKASLEEVTSRFEEIYQGTPEMPGLRRFETLIPSHAILEELAGLTRLGIVTGRPRADARCFIHEQGIEDYFSCVVCREDGPLKPDPTPLRIALEQLQARTAWMLGDTTDDVRAAVAAGVVPVGVVSPGQDGDEERETRMVLNNAGAARIVSADAEFGGLFNEL